MSFLHDLYEEDRTMNSSDYNRFFRAVEAANSVRDDDACRQALRRIYADMCSQYSSSDDDVEHLYRKFRLRI